MRLFGSFHYRHIQPGAAIYSHLFGKKAAATGDARYDAAAARVLRHLSGQLKDHPEVWPAAVVAANLYPVNDAELASAANATAPSGGTRSTGEVFHTPETADHVHASVAPKVGPNDDEIIVTLKVDDGYHINANPASFDYLIPTSVVLDRLKPSKVKYPKPIRFKSDFARDGLDLYEGTVSLIASFPKGSLKGRKKIEGAVTAQARNTQTCLPPSKLPLSISATAE